MCKPLRLAGLVLALSCASAHGLDIVLRYDEQLSDAPDFDPDGSRLGALVESAVTIFEDIIEDDATLNLAYTWGDLGSDGTLGVATAIDIEGQRPVSSRMRFNANDAVNWFLDPTPLDHSEFELLQSTVADLDSNTRNEAYTGTPPEQLEVGFAGVRRQSFGTTDLLSVIIHEIGHAVGLGTTSIGAAAIDGDFDVDSDLVGGATLGIRVSTEDDIAHLSAPRSAMFPAIIPDIRRLPSATDILAISSAAGWNEIDLPRKDFLVDGPGRWSDPAGWVGGQAPDADDAVTVRTGEEIRLDDAAFAQSVDIRDGSSLHVSGGLQADELSLGAATHMFVLGDDFSGIQLSGAATLDGTLAVDARPDELAIGDTFNVISSSGLSGAFDEIRSNFSDPNRGLVIDAFADSISATVALVGDTNLDAEVNFADFLILSRNFGTDGSWREGNFNDDETIDFGDFLAFSRNFGRRAPSIASVPEATPSGWLLLLLTACRLKRRRR